MKVLHLIGGELSGGAAKGAYDLHKGLLELGVDSKILTNSKEVYDDKTVETIAGRDNVRRFVSLARGQADASLQNIHPRREKVPFHAGIFGFDFTKSEFYRKADIVHLHWICNGFVSVFDLAKVKKKIVWTVRDMWPMTGGCHYSMGCEGYIHGCGECPFLKSRFKYDFSRFNFNLKNKYYSDSMYIIGISKWISKCASNSSLFKNSEIRTFFNNINTGELFPVNKKHARDILKLPAGRKIILVGAPSFKSNYKGFDLGFEALKRMKSDELIVFFGRNLDFSKVQDVGRDYIHLGFLNDTVSLRLAYSAADVFLAPSRMEAFGKTLAESMACGTPVVCFDATGPKDIVDHKITGYKAMPYEIEDLARGLRWVLERSEEEAFQLGRRSRVRVKENFDTAIIARKYIDLYNDVARS